MLFWEWVPHSHRFESYRNKRKQGGNRYLSAHLQERERERKSFFPFPFSLFCQAEATDDEQCRGFRFQLSFSKRSQRRRMEDGSSSGGGANSSSKTPIAGTSEETIHINIKTLDSNVFTLEVEKKEPVSLLKEEIAGAVSLLPEQQHLIFMGRVLKDDQLLSDHYIEDGDTLHLVLRQPVLSESQNTTNSGEARTTENQGESPYNDLSQIFRSLFSSLVVDSAGNTSATNTPNMHANASQSLDGSNQRENQSMLLHPTVIPDSLATLSAFISHMESALSVYSGYQSPAPSNAQSVRSSHPLQYPSPDTLITLLERVKQLLSGYAGSALSHLSANLERERGSTDLAVRGQIQVEAMHIGTTIHHLGSLLLELGRTISTLRMGDSLAESMVNSGPSVYISASGPNPIMVQPVPQQASLLCSLPLPPIMNIPFPDLFAFVRNTSRDINIPAQTGTSASTAEPTADSRTNSGGASQEQTSNLESALPNSNQTARNGPQGNGQTDTPQPHSDPNLDNARQLPENKVAVNARETDGPNNSASCHPSDAGTEEPKDKSTQPYQESIGNDEQHLIMMPDMQELSVPPINYGVGPSGLRESQQVQEQIPNLGGMLSEMVQQMMPVISQALGANPSNMSTSIAGDKGLNLQNGNDMLDERNLQMNLQPAAEGIELQDSPRDVFHSLLQVANQLYGGNCEILNDIGGDDDLINEFMEMLRRQAGFRQLD